MSFFRPSKTPEPNSPEHAYRYSIFLLGRRMRTEFEMRRKLGLRGYEPAVIDQTLTKLYEEKLLDDHHYAEVYFNNLKEYRSLGYYGIKKKLTEKRLPSNIVTKILQQLTPAVELTLGKKFLLKEMGESKKSGLLPVQKQKLARKLQARGFRLEVISRLIL